MTVEVTAAGVDTWSPSWYVDPDGPVARVLEQVATVPGKRGAMYVDHDQVPVLGYRVGWFRSGLLFAEGHPDPGGELCPAYELPVRALELQEALHEVGLGVATCDAELWSLGDRWADGPLHTSRPMAPGWAGFRRVDATVNLAMPTRAAGLATLAGIAALVRDSPGKADVWYGPDRGVESVVLRGHAGKRVLGRWYDKGLESSAARRGLVVRAEDQRRWSKGDRRDLDELTGAALRSRFQRRFYPLYRASKGVTVSAPEGLAVKVAEAVEQGYPAVRARMLLGDVLLERAGVERQVMKRSSFYRSRAWRHELGLVLADGVLEEVEIHLEDVLEEVLETELWERRG